MTCADFENAFDAYVDDMLDPQMSEACSRHLAKCPPCDREVTRWQQTRILLSTAVADFATAVDVSSLRRDVEAALGLGEREAAQVAQEEAPRRQGGLREAAVQRGGEARRSGGREARRAAAPARHSRFSAVLRFASAATASATIAAAAVLYLAPVQQMETGAVVASNSSGSRTPFSVKGLRPNVFAASLGNIAPVAYTQPPLARPAISHVDALEGAPGRLVSTWVQPKTNARVIWVQDSGAGAPIVTAGLDR